MEHITALDTRPNLSFNDFGCQTCDDVVKRVAQNKAKTIKGIIKIKKRHDRSDKNGIQRSGSIQN